MFVGTLPAGFRPFTYAAVPIYPDGFIVIKTNGEVTIIRSGTGDCYVSVTYVVGS